MRYMLRKLEDWNRDSIEVHAQVCPEISRRSCMRYMLRSAKAIWHCMRYMRTET